MDETLLARYPDLERSHFWWVTRRRLVRRLFKELFETTRPQVLEVGCGTGMTAQMLAQNGAHVVGVDVAPQIRSGEPASYRFIQGEYLATSPSLGQFDLVMALDAVEHFENEARVIQSLWSNVRPGGYVIVTVPAYSWLWSSHDVENRHFRRYTRRSLEVALKSIGFSVERVGYLFAALVIPKALTKVIEGLRSSPVPLGRRPDSAMNQVARRYFAAESWVAIRLKNFLPLGTSVLAIAVRPDHEPTGPEV